MEYLNISKENRLEVTNFIKSQWLSTNLIIRGEIVDMNLVDGIAVYENNQIIGLITYTITNYICEITSLDSLIENKGIGSSLIDKVIDIAKQNGCIKVIVITTNDNINAIRFYQKRGFDMARLYHNALNVSRKLKCEIPLLGLDQIPLLHEIEFEYLL